MNSRKGRRNNFKKIVREIANVVSNMDFLLLIAIVLISLFGVVMVYSASMVAATDEYGLESDFFYDKQKRALLIGMVAFFVVTFIPYKLFCNKAISWMIMFVSVGLLLCVLIFGESYNGATSWFSLFGISIQPAEACKLTFILFLAAYLHRHQKTINTRDFPIGPLFWAIGIIVLILMQPDFGTSAIIFAIGLCMALASGYNLKRVSIIILLIGAAIAVFLLSDGEHLSEEKQARLTTYKNPFEYEDDEGYQQVGSLLAIEAGGLSGVGLGESKQKYGYLPEPYTDFIIAIIAEELGYVGVCTVLAFLGFIVYRCMYWAWKAKDHFGRLVCVGMGSWIAIQTFINMGGAISMIPLTGVTLPFISAGGTSLVILLVGMGIVMSIAARTKIAEKEAIE